jgi:hypothetical protein
LTAKRLLIASLPIALLAACDQGAPADDSRSASGEVLEGTISDAMLPLDTVQSEPPFEDPKAAKAVQDKAAAEAGETPAEGEAAEPAAEATPAAEPAPEPAD